MLNTYTCSSNQLSSAHLPGISSDLQHAVWIDLLNPTVEEDRAVEKLLGISIPTRDEMEEIELSSRLYHEDGAEFMTMTVIVNMDGEEPMKTPVTFILKGKTLVTVRYAEPKPFLAYATRAQRPNSVVCNTGEFIMLGLVEAIIARMADTLEKTGIEIDLMSRSVFSSRVMQKNKKKTLDLQSVIQQIGHKGDVLTMLQESLITVSRMVTYHSTLSNDRDKATQQHMKLLYRDAASLSEHATFLSHKITFLLDATLGLISLEQNQIIKMFSVAAVVFLPPTLVASIYGMNFDYMPELQWLAGYPWALGLMALSAVLPYLYSKKRGWL